MKKDDFEKAILYHGVSVKYIYLLIYAQKYVITYFIQCLP